MISETCDHARAHTHTHKGIVVFKGREPMAGTLGFGIKTRDVVRIQNTQETRICSVRLAKA